MPNQPCPVCGQSTVKDLEATNRIAHVNYYSCAVCYHIWTTDRHTGEFLRHITPPPGADGDQENVTTHRPTPGRALH